MVFIHTTDLKNMLRHVGFGPSRGPRNPSPELFKKHQPNKVTDEIQNQVL
jgi:hypothetical protein